ncbi:MAG: hypothetical protein JSV94_01970 [Methanobacteriota archaeon]|nr:MAG: hypothetical protein JSV94_01970 [Euryarchaeota archaeon]
MAKKRKKDKARKEEEYEFKPPEFDEKEFLRKEIRDTKTVLMTVGYAACFGLVAAALSSISSRLIGVSFLLVFVGLYSLKYFYPFIRVDTGEFQKKNWAGNVAWFFFTFLAVWVLTFNYPISDHANPAIEDVVVWVTDNDTGNVTALDYKFLSSAGTYAWVPRVGESFSLQPSANYTINITAHISDNGVLTVAEIAFASVSSTYYGMVAEENGRFGFEVPDVALTSGTPFMFFIHAEDDHSNEFTFVPVGIPVV